MTRRHWLAAGPSAAALVLAGCRGVEERADLVFINPNEPSTLDPALASDQASGRVITSLFEGLMRWNEAGQAVPGVAVAKPEVSADGLQYRFRLREDARWSTGEPVTAQDFIASWERVLNPRTAADYVTLLHVIKNAKAYSESALTDFSQVGLAAPDARTLVVTLEHPAPYFTDLCAFTTYCPVHVRSLEVAGPRAWDPEFLVGNGAYRLAEWRLNYRLVLDKSPTYWDRESVAMRRVELRTVTNAVSALNYFVTGTADLAMDKNGVPATLVDSLRRQPYFHSGPMLATGFMRFNCAVPDSPFADPRVRRAFGLSLDRQRLVERVTRMGEPAAYSLVPPGCGDGYDPPRPEPLFDVAEARRLLADAGYPGGKGFPLVRYLFPILETDMAMAIEIQAMWENALGVKILPQKQEWKVYLDSMGKTNYDICRSSWVGDYNDPNTFLDMFLAESGNNRTGWKSAEYDGLIAAAAKEADREKRFALFRQAETLLIQTQAVISPVWHYVGVQFYWPDKLAGVQSNLVDEHPFRCLRWL
jgi:oligopeptide transport system substrate-binding protein